LHPALLTTLPHPGRYLKWTSPATGWREGSDPPGVLLVAESARRGVSGETGPEQLCVPWGDPVGSFLRAVPHS